MTPGPPKPGVQEARGSSEGWEDPSVKGSVCLYFHLLGHSVRVLPAGVGCSHHGPALAAAAPAGFLGVWVAPWTVP